MAQARLATMEIQNLSLQKATEDALLSSLEMREPNSRVHSLRLKAYATHLAKLIGYPASVLPHLQSAAMLHDIGKLGLPFDILNNPGVLPATQLEALKPHTWLGERILNDITFLRPAARMVRHHHERWDGSGYPDKLTGENIPQGSRILAIVDTLDAITNEQTYRPAQTFQEAIAEIARWSGRQFDPALIAEFRRVPAKTWAQLREEVESNYKPLSPLPVSQNSPAA
jgi:HD-GYP domain-containing protein (c-di-GMP phosphodiesterase class II)